MKILITGGSGFIGSRLLQLLDELGLSTHFYILANSKASYELRTPYTIISSQSFNEFQDQFDSIIHLAQERNYRDFPKQARSIFDCNILLTQQLLDLALKNQVKHFLYVSSGSVYDLSKSPITEESSTQVSDYYSFSKLTSENLINLYSKFFKTTILRLFNPYGPNLGDKFFSRIVKQIQNDQPIKIYPGKDFSFNPIYLDDICFALIESLKQAPQGTFNLGGDEVVNFRKVIDMISKISKKDLIIQESLDANKYDMIARPTKLVNEINFKFKTRLENGLQKFIEFNG